MKRERDARKVRSISINAIAVYQFFRAAVLLYVLLVLSRDAEAGLGSHAGIGIIVLLVTQRIVIGHYSLLSSALVVLFLLAAFYAATGFGLLLLNKWAQRATIFMSVAAILRTIFVVWVLSSHRGSALSIEQQAIMSFFLFLDCIIITTLLFESKAFHDD